MKNLIRHILLEEASKVEYQVRDIGGPTYYKRHKGEKWSFTDEVDFYKNSNRNNLVKWDEKKPKKGPFVRQVEVPETFKNRIDYIETASTISSKSAGPSTRLNLDEYIYSTQRAINYFAGVKKCKAILNLNPAIPCINMETTTYAKIKGKKVSNVELTKFKKSLKTVILKLKKYVKGHKIIVEPSLIDDVLVVKTNTIGAGDYLPSYAGNLDIINCAAIAAGEDYAKKI